MNVSEKLAVFVTGDRFDDGLMARFVRMSLFDWATVGIAGLDEPVSRSARAVALGMAPLVRFWAQHSAGNCGGSAVT